MQVADDSRVVAQQSVISFRVFVSHVTFEIPKLLLHLPYAQIDGGAVLTLIAFEMLIAPRRVVKVRLHFRQNRFVRVRFHLEFVSPDDEVQENRRHGGDDHEVHHDHPRQPHHFAGGGAFPQRQRQPDAEPAADAAADAAALAAAVNGFEFVGGCGRGAQGIGSVVVVVIHAGVRAVVTVFRRRHRGGRDISAAVTAVVVVIVVIAVGDAGDDGG